MQSKSSEAERARSQPVELADQYRPIGPAAVLAAVICAAKKIDAGATKKAA